MKNEVIAEVINLYPGKAQKINCLLKYALNFQFCLLAQSEIDTNSFLHEALINHSERSCNSPYTSWLECPFLQMNVDNRSEKMLPKISVS